MASSLATVLVVVVATAVFFGCFTIVPCVQGDYACLGYRAGMQTCLVLSICLVGTLFTAFGGPSTAYCAACLSVTPQKYVKYDTDSHRFSAKCETCGRTNQFETWMTT